MNRLTEYLNAADRDTTRRSYESAIRHFEVEWHGLLPATQESVALYLADHATILSLNTLRHRLAALARWHIDQGFADPTKSPLVRQVFKGIRTLHPSIEKRARPLQIDVLQQVCEWIDSAMTEARDQHDRAGQMRLTRDRAILLLGFWRGFRADELVNLQIEHIDIKHGEGLVCYLPRSKSDREAKGRQFSCPALSRLCPVTAVEAWLAQSSLSSGPLFRKIDRWGVISSMSLLPNSIISLLRRLFIAADVTTAAAYSSHSLRRGFAGWARENGWDFKELMEYVGWRDIKSAMRYLESSPDQLKARFEQGLPPITVTPPTVELLSPVPSLP